MQNLITLVGIALFIIAAYSDLTTFRIPNVLVAAVALLAVARLTVLADPRTAVYTVGASVIVLAIGFVLFWRGFVGGGDAKLITAAALLVGHHDLVSFLASMAIAGAVISLVVLVMHWPSRAITKPYVPYGLAVAAAGGVTLFFRSPLAVSFIG